MILYSVHQVVSEIGQYIIYGSLQWQHIEVTQEPTVAEGAFTPHEITNRFQQGAWAQAEIWGRMHFTVAEDLSQGQALMLEAF